MLVNTRDALKTRVELDLPESFRPHPLFHEKLSKDERKRNDSKTNHRKMDKCRSAYPLRSQFGERSRFSKGTGCYFSAGYKMSFCTRQFKSSATNKVFSEGQEISCTQPNWPGCLPGFPNAPRIFPSRSSL